MATRGGARRNKGGAAARSRCVCCAPGHDSLPPAVKRSVKRTVHTTFLRRSPLQSCTADGGVRVQRAGRDGEGNRREGARDGVWLRRADAARVRQTARSGGRFGRRVSALRGIGPRAVARAISFRRERRRSERTAAARFHRSVSESILLRRARRKAWRRPLRPRASPAGCFRREPCGFAAACSRG